MALNALRPSRIRKQAGHSIIQTMLRRRITCEDVRFGSRFAPQSARHVNLTNVSQRIRYGAIDYMPEWQTLDPNLSELFVGHPGDALPDLSDQVEHMIPLINY